MRVLVACEESQITTKAFRRYGCEAFSADIQDCSGGFPEWHIKGDVRNVLFNREWDLIIAHPPCTFLSIAGACNLYKNGEIDQRRLEQMRFAAQFFHLFYDLKNVRVCIENPRALKIANLPPFSQTIQPFEFGDPYSKLTCLWLKHLPYLLPDCYTVNKRFCDGCASWVGTHHGSVQRSKSFEGIANAMAKQWHNLPPLREVYNDY